MLYINGSDIRLTRGDTAYLQVPIYNGDTEYELQENDILVFTLKRAISNRCEVFQKRLEGTNIFHILPEDTARCDFGTYRYDVQLTTAQGDVYTVIEPACFELLPEVTC